MCEKVLVNQVAHLRWQIHEAKSCLIVKLVELLDVHAAVLLGLGRNAGARLDEGAELVALDVVVAQAVLAESHVEGAGVVRKGECGLVYEVFEAKPDVWVLVFGDRCVGGGLSRI